MLLDQPIPQAMRVESVAASWQLLATSQQIHRVATYDARVSETIEFLLVLDGFESLVHVVREAAVGVEGDEASAQLLEGDVDLAENVDGHSILEGRAAKYTYVRAVRVENGGKNEKGPPRETKRVERSKR